MKLKTIFMSAALLAGCLTASAQQPQAAETKPCDGFAPHWYVQAQIGGQYTLGEVKFSKLLSGNFQVAGGYNFTPVWGLRLALNTWQSKGGTDFSNYSNPLYSSLGVQTWKYNYLAPTVDVTCDLTNWILGYKQDRICNFGLLAGLGMNIGWNNDEANDLKAQLVGLPYTDIAHTMSLCWDGTKTRFVGRVGAYVDFNISRRVALGLEMNCNATSDHYNSKKADNADWYFNALAGVKVKLGKLAPKVSKEPIVVEKIVEKIVEKPVEKVVVKEPEAPKRETLRRDIFFTLRGSEVSRTEMTKVEDVVAYLNKYPDSRVSVTGYADKGTGNPRINVGYAQRRADVITNMLVNKFGIARSRITSDSKGDTVQPYEQNNLNRVTICICE